MGNRWASSGFIQQVIALSGLLVVFRIQLGVQKRSKTSEIFICRWVFFFSSDWQSTIRL
jgi:hypothetical protein